MTTRASVTTAVIALLAAILPVCAHATPIRECEQSRTPNESIVDEVPWGQTLLQLDRLWQFATGDRQVVAVIDTGVNQHPRFGNRVLGGGDYITKGQDGRNDCDGHGTAVAGIIAASQDPSTGFAGVAPNAAILAIRQTGDTTTLAQAIRRAADWPGVTVINVSQAACISARSDQNKARDLQAAVHYAVAEKNIVLVAAAGNLEAECGKQNKPHALSTVVFPAAYDQDVLAVAAIEDNGAAAAFSVHGPWVDIAAPGTKIVSTIQGRWQELQGTSFAAAYVSGVAALVRQRFPNLSAYQVMKRIESTAQHISNRKDDALGYGVINALAALTAVIPAEGQASHTAAPNRLSINEPHSNESPHNQFALVISTIAFTVLGLVLLLTQLIPRRKSRV